jgi:hypothetical protein
LTRKRPPVVGVGSESGSHRSALTFRARGFISDDRAQTVLDYGIAVGIFFVALVFVLGTIPGMFAPFVGSSGDTQVADRLASSLSGDMLGSPSEPFILNATCTEEFFRQLDTNTTAPTSCRFDTTADSLRTMFALDGTTNVRVEITRSNGTTRTLDETTLVAGGSLPTQQTVSTARRVVSLDGETHTLEVYVW